MVEGHGPSTSSFGLPELEEAIEARNSLVLHHRLLPFLCVVYEGLGRDAIVWRTEKGDELTLGEELVAIFHNLVGAANQIHLLRAQHTLRRLV